MTRDELIEKLAEVEHQRWSDWQKWVHDSGSTLNLGKGSLGTLIPQERINAWEQQIATPYADLTEAEKQSDREQVARYWPLIVLFVRDWLRGEGDGYYDDAWMDQMGTREVMAAIRELSES